MKTFLSLIFLLPGFLSSGQTQLLKDYNFDEGGYYLLGVRSESDANDLADSLGEFYTDDIKVLNDFKTAWTFKKPSPQYACGYHYDISICRNGLALENFYINLNCNEIATDKGFFYFETQKLRMFKNQLKKPYQKTESLTSLSEAREYRTKILSDNRLILTPTPYWTEYEGTFKFTYVCQNGDEKCLTNEKKLLDTLTAQIEKTYPGEIFELDGQGGSNTELFIEVKCNKSLADRFQQYKRDLEFDKWEEYKLWLTTYWTVKLN